MELTQIEKSLRKLIRTVAILQLAWKSLRLYHNTTASATSTNKKKGFEVELKADS